MHFAATNTKESLMNIDEPIILHAVGDISLGDHPVCFGHGVRTEIDKNGLQTLFENTKKQLSSADIVFGNLETVLPDDTGSTELFDMEMKGKSEYAGELAKVGFNVMSVANNHAMQHGDKAFNDTTATLHNCGISPIGISEGGASNCFSFNKKETKIAIIGYSFRPEKYSKTGVLYAVGNKTALLNQVKQLKNNGQQVIVSLHWGEEYLHYPSVEQIQLAKDTIDSGACLILGHHPHVLQGIEEYNNGVIVYSLGNYIFDMWQKQTRESIIFKCEIDQSGIKHYDYLPVLANKKNYQPRLLTGKKAEELNLKIQGYSNSIDSCIGDKNLTSEMIEYNKAAEKAYTKYRMESYF
jgi:poly-gamma-glutamate synthesis protein (capsule biosynthesis protein)